MDFGVFKFKAFSIALFSNTTFHLSMLAVMTIMPIVVERRFGLDPIFVLWVLLPQEFIGVFVVILAGWYYDKHRPKLLRMMPRAINRPWHHPGLHLSPNPPKDTDGRGEGSGGGG